jgi:hypothetical protein
MSKWIGRFENCSGVLWTMDLGTFIGMDTPLSAISSMPPLVFGPRCLSAHVYNCWSTFYTCMVLEPRRLLPDGLSKDGISKGIASRLRSDLRRICQDVGVSLEMLDSPIFVWNASTDYLPIA